MYSQYAARRLKNSHLVDVKNKRHRLRRKNSYERYLREGTHMSNDRMNKKLMQRNYINQVNDIKRCMVHQEEMLEELISQVMRQQEILGLYYKEYQQLKRHNEKQYLMTFIRMRESMLKDMARYEQNHQTNTTGYKLLNMYVNEYTDILEDHGVEIVDCSETEFFDPEIQKPIERISVVKEEYDNKICKVYSSGYRWNGIILKKIDVAVGVYKLL